MGLTDIDSSPAPGSALLAHVADALDEATIGAWRWDMVQNRVEWSSSLERIHGLEPGTFPGTFDAYASDIHPDDRDAVFAQIRRSIEDRQPHRLEYRIIIPSGDVRWVEARGRLLTDAQGTPVALSGICMDVTARKRREEELERARAELADHARLATLTAEVGIAASRAGTMQEMLQRAVEAVVEQLGAAFARIWTLNAAEQVLELQVSAGMYTHVNGPHGRVPVGKFKIGLIAEERRPHLTNQVVGDPRVGDQAWAQREGMIAFAGYPLIIGDELVGVLAMFARHPLSAQDLRALETVANGLAVGIARQRVEHDLRESDERFHLVARATNDAIWDWNFLTGQVWWNDGFRNMFGYPLESLEPGPESWTSRIHPEDIDRISHSIHEAIEGTLTTWSDEYRFRRVDGTWADIYDRGIIVRDPAGKARRMLGSMMDITERTRAARELRDYADELLRLTQALERSNRDLDSFAYVASHDLKAPLRGITNLSQWIEEELGAAASESVRKHLGLLRGRVSRMESLIEGILAYSRAGRQVATAEPVAVERLVREVVDLLSPPPGVVIDVAPGMPVLHTERLPLQQVFLNLIGNAIKHAAQPAGRITVACRHDGDTVDFAVADNGPGIAPAYHDKVWGIFQTLAPRDKVEGTGIGLALVKKIVESRGGQVSLESEEGGGATFRFTWPASPAKESSAGADDDHSPRRG